MAGEASPTERPGSAMRSFIFVLLLAATTSSHSEDRSPELQLLFGSETHGLSAAEQRAIFEALDLRLAPDGKQFLDSSCEMPATMQVDYPDLNRDGAPEVLVTYGNTCLSGNTGTSVLLFVKGDGRYRANLGFPGAEVTALDASNLGYRDLLIGGPGFCFPVWRWNGREYEFLRSEPQQPGGCDQR